MSTIPRKYLNRMNPPRTCFCLLLLTASFVTLETNAARAEDALRELAAKAPGTTNAIVLFNVEQALTSSIAQKEGWKDRLDKAYASGMISIPPDCSRLIMAAELDFGTWDPQWELALVDMTRNVSLTNVARQTKGTPDTVADLSAVALREDAYLVQFEPQRLGAMSPANRQAVVRWIREVKNRSTPALSDYLQKAIVTAEKSDLVEALDMEDAVPAEVIRNKLSASPALTGKKVDLEALVSLLASLQGTTFEVKFTEARHARFVVDFDQDATLLADIGKPLLLEILAEAGSRIEDLDEWTPKVDGHRFTLTGKLTPTGMRKVLSLINAPLSSLVSANHSEENGGTQATQISQMGYTSQTYFKGIQSILDDVAPLSKEAKTFGQNAAWFDRWAKQIERMPMVNVDKDLLDYGSFVVGHLRGCADALRGIGIRSGQRTAQVYNSINVGYSGYSGGYFEWNNVDSERRAVRADERAKGATDAREIYRQIEKATGDVRRLMTERYQLPF